MLAAIVGARSSFACAAHLSKGTTIRRQLFDEIAATSPTMLRARRKASALTLIDPAAKKLRDVYSRCLRAVARNFRVRFEAAEDAGAMNERLPDFIHVGPTRTGTTWLYAAVTGRVGLPDGIKETRFFSNRYYLGHRWYAGLFRNCPPDLPIGEFSPQYFDSIDARKRIAANLSGCRIICTLREPVERLYSIYRLNHRLGNTSSSFEDYLNEHAEHFDACRYAHHIGEWRKLFPADQILILFHDDLVVDPQHYLDRFCDYVGISKISLAEHPPPESAKNSIWSTTRGPLSARLRNLYLRLKSTPGTRGIGTMGRGHLRALLTQLVMRPFPELDRDLAGRLRCRFKGEVSRLEELTQRDLSHWK